MSVKQQIRDALKVQPCPLSGTMLARLCGISSGARAAHIARKVGALVRRIDHTSFSHARYEIGPSD